MVMNAQDQGLPGGVDSKDVDRIVRREQAELQRRESLCRGNAPPSHAPAR